MKTIIYAVRFLLRSKSYTSINLLGLAFSLALKLEDRQTRCNWDWESHKTLCWRNTEGLREEKKYQQGQHNCPLSLGGSS